MFVGNRDEVYAEPSLGWLDHPDYEAASDAGAINLHQSTGMLKDVLRLCVNGVFEMVENGQLDPKGIGWWVTHYSSHLFREQAYDLFVRGGITIPPDRIYTNLTTAGNVGSASFPLMLGDLFRSGSLRPGQRILCIVPESGRFLFGYVVLRVVGEETDAQAPKPSVTPWSGAAEKATAPVDGKTASSVAPDIKTSGTAIEEALVRQLAQVWTEFENRLHRVPINDIAKANLMVDGSSWSRQFVMPLIRPFCRLATCLLNIVKTFIPKAFTSA